MRVDPLFQAPDPALVSGASVTFEPGARTAWHAHPLGQTLIVTSGCGWAQREGGPIEEIRPGDVVWFSPGEKHWHGATPTTWLTHIAIQEKLNGKVVEWMEHMTDALNISKDDVLCHVTPLGGGFGRKSKPDYVAEAALLSEQAGKSVKIVWSREDDIHFDYFDSPAGVYVKAAVGQNGLPAAWLQRE